MTDSLVRVAEAFTRGSKAAVEMDPQLSLSEVVAATQLSLDEAKNALNLLVRENSLSIRRGSPDSGLDTESDGTAYFARPALFVKYDALTVGTDPRADAAFIAQRVPRERGTSLSLQNFMKDNGWSIRRTNPAIFVLLSSGRFDGAQSFDGSGLLRHALWYKGNF